MPVTIDKVLGRIESLLERIEKHLPASDASPDWNKFIAFRWRRSASLFGHRGHLAGVAHPHVITFDDLRISTSRKHVSKPIPASSCSARVPTISC
jgi:predicted AAA+ superfamily ATPase